MLDLGISTVDQMKQAIDLAYQRNVGYVYVTDDSPAGGANPFDSLPSYWTQEVTYVASVPEPGSAWAAFAGFALVLLRRRAAAV